ncbi:hypothetical protein AHAS_Ahas15G0096400 [Arachis hypogaea]
MSSLISVTVAQLLSHKLSLSRLRSSSLFVSSLITISYSVALTRLSCPRRRRRQKQQVPGLVIVVAPCLVTVSHSIPCLCCHCSTRRPRRQKQQVPGLIVIVVFLLRLLPSASSSPSASFAQPEAGLQFG